MVNGERLKADGGSVAGRTVKRGCKNIARQKSKKIVRVRRAGGGKIVTKIVAEPRADSVRRDGTSRGGGEVAGQMSGVGCWVLDIRW